MILGFATPGIPGMGSMCIYRYVDIYIYVYIYLYYSCYKHQDVLFRYNSQFTFVFSTINIHVNPCFPIHVLRRPNVVAVYDTLDKWTEFFSLTEPVTGATGFAVEIPKGKVSKFRPLIPRGKFLGGCKHPCRRDS